MDSLDLFPTVATEAEQRWPTRKPTLQRSETLSPDGERLFAYEHADIIPLLVDRPVPANRVGADLGWRVAFDAIAVKVTVRGRVAACLRPLAIGECDQLRHGEVLCCEDQDFHEHRDIALEAMSHGERRRVLLQSGNMLLALLDPLPPGGAEALRAATETELAMLRQLRVSGITRDELRVLLNARDSQFTNATNSTRAHAAQTTLRLTHEQAARAESHTGLVRAIAGRVIGSVGQRVMSRQEFESAGNEALVQAAARYDPTRSTATFATFAHYRVYGAMIDALRKRTPGRRKRDQGQQGRARSALSVRVPERDLRGRERFVADGPNPEQALIATDMRHRLWALVENLEPHEQALIEALYVQDRPTHDFAREVGTSSATISRRHAKTLERLRRRLLAQGVVSSRALTPIDH